MANPVNDVVRFIVNAGDSFEDGDSISNMKLQKLLYYCQGFHLAFFEGEALFDERVEAWEHGPVVPVVWRRFREFGRDPIRIRAAGRPDFQEAQLNLMWNVYSVYGQYSAWKLRRMTHEEAPWKEAWERGQGIGAHEGQGPGDYEITRESMARFFKTRLRKNRGR